MPRRRSLKISPKHESQNTLTQLNFFDGFPAFPIGTPPKTRPPVPLFVSPPRPRTVKRRRLVPDSDEESDEDLSEHLQPSLHLPSHSSHPKHPEQEGPTGSPSLPLLPTSSPSGRTIIPLPPSASKSPRANGSSPLSRTPDKSPFAKRQRTAQTNSSPVQQLSQQSQFSLREGFDSGRSRIRVQKQKHRPRAAREVPDSDEYNSSSYNEQSMDDDESHREISNGVARGKETLEERPATPSGDDALSSSPAPLVGSQSGSLTNVKLWADEDLLPAWLVNESIPLPPEASDDD